MNADNAKQYLPLVQALADGKTVQLQAGSSWIDLADVEFERNPERYRVKPEPRERWVVAGRNCEYVFDTQQEADYCSRVHNSPATLFREVL